MTGKDQKSGPFLELKSPRIEFLPTENPGSDIIGISKSFKTSKLTIEGISNSAGELKRIEMYNLYILCLI